MQKLMSLESNQVLAFGLNKIHSVELIAYQFPVEAIKKKDSASGSFKATSYE